MNQTVLRRIILLISCVILLVPLTVSAQATSDLQRPSSKEWLTVGGDWGQTRYSTLAQINTDNVKNLKGA